MKFKNATNQVFSALILSGFLLANSAFAQFMERRSDGRFSFGSEQDVREFLTEISNTEELEQLKKSDHTAGTSDFFFGHEQFVLVEDTAPVIWKELVQGLSGKVMSAREVSQLIDQSCQDQLDADLKEHGVSVGFMSVLENQIRRRILTIKLFNPFWEQDDELKKIVSDVLRS